MSVHVQVFRDDEAGYLTWIAENPNGWVLNVPRAPSGTVERIAQFGLALAIELIEKPASADAQDEQEP
jgi:hypothetical protein